MSAREAFLEGFLQQLCMFLIEHWHEFQLDHYEDTELMERVREFVAAS